MLSHYINEIGKVENDMVLLKDCRKLLDSEAEMIAKATK